ncbi:MAG: oligoendopeptidase F [Christensenellales bacterium]
METKTRKEIDNLYKWKLEDMYATDEDWERSFRRMDENKHALEKFRGKLNNADDILAYLKENAETDCEISKLYVYARMRKDQDVSVTKYQEMSDKIENLAVELGSIYSFVRVELSANSKEFLTQLSQRPEFADFDYELQEIARFKDRTLSDAEEKLIADVKSFSDLFHDAFEMFDNADIKFEPFVDGKGNTVKLSHGLYGVYLQSDDREDRRKAFESMFGAYKGMINTISTLYCGNVKKNNFFAKARKYDSALQMAMDGENVTPKVYEKLVKCIDDSLPLLHDYMKYRRQKLGYDQLHMYDLHTAIFESKDENTDYATAKKIVKDGLKPLGKEYAQLLDQAFDEGWIDVYENKGKRSGAYSWGSYGCHPYVLLNYNGTIHDIFTIAHELGHAMHSYYSNLNQPYSKAGYEIFVAEVASTVNETLLLRSMLKDADSQNKKYLLSYLLDMFRTTVFRQTQFAEFEAKAHEMAANGISLTPQSLSETYYCLNKKYYGEDGVCQDDLIRYEWARIPHFYRSFYVYKYATGLISAVCIADDILNKGEVAVQNYKKFLSAGGSMPPVEILKLAGVDLTKDDPYKKAMKIFGDTLAQLKESD